MNIPEWLLRSVKVNKDWNGRIGKYSNIFVHILCTKLTSTGSTSIQVYLYTFYAENLLPQVVNICFIGWLFISSYLLSWNEKMYYSEEINWDTEPIVPLAMFIVFYSIFVHVVYFVAHPTICLWIFVFVVYLCIWSSIPRRICNKKRPAVRWQPWLALCSSSLTYDNDDHDLYMIIYTPPTVIQPS